MSLVQRIKTIFSHSPEPIDAIVLKNASSPFIDSSFFYVTGLKKGLFEGCSVILYPDGSVHLLVSSLEEPLVPPSFNMTTFSTKKQYSDHIQRLTQNTSTIGLNTKSLLYDDYQQLQQLLPEKKIVSISNAIVASRTIKDKDELNYIQQACSIADQVVAKIPTFFTEPITEQELAAEIDHQLKQLGSSSPAFETISSFGSNTAKPHYTSGTKIIEAGDFILCDFGATIHHYHSDITRTFTYGKATDKQRHIHQTVLSAQKQALQSIKPGIAANKIHQIVVKTIDQSPFKGHFIHSTGHGLGLDVHDPGIGFAASDESILQAGMVLTVEPGIYIPDFGGIRIEDDIVVTPDGYLKLTTSTKNLIEIPIV